MAVAKECALQSFDGAAELQRKACGHGRITRIRVARTARFVVLQEDFADRAVAK